MHVFLRHRQTMMIVLGIINPHHMCGSHMCLYVCYHASVQMFLYVIAYFITRMMGFEMCLIELLSFRM